MANQPVPLWLADEAELRALLGAVVDRFDEQSGDERKQRLYVSAEKYLHSLQRMDADADQSWRFVRALEAMGLLSIVAGKRDAYDADWKNARLAFAVESESVLRHWLDRPAGESAIESWRAVVLQHAESFPGGVELLLKRRLTIPGYADDEVLAALARITAVTQPLTLRQLSALIFCGDSKRLDEREDLIRALYPALPLKPRPLVVAVHLPEDCKGVLFIENQDTYAAAVEGGLPETRNLALVYVAGFRGGAQRVRERGVTLLHYSGSVVEREGFEDWWFENRSAPGPCRFFGDLDFSGMAILAALRERFGDVTAWRPGYAPLLERLRAGFGHAPGAAEKQQQVDPGNTGCVYADTELLPAARTLGFADQETPIIQTR